MAVPLHALLKGPKKKGKRRLPLQPPGIQAWDAACDQAFSDLKQKLTEAPLLGYPDFTRPYILEVDASKLGLGAVLSQDQEHGRVVLGYASRSLRENERNMSNYSSRKLELLALKWAVTEKYKDLLLGTECLVYTDNDPLTYIQSTTSKLGAIEMRWVAELANYDLVIKHRAGRVNKNADSLSRKTAHTQETAFLEHVHSSVFPQAAESTAVPRELRGELSNIILEVWNEEMETAPQRLPPVMIPSIGGRS